MKVTDLDYPIEDRLLKKLDLMIARCVQEHPEKDAVIINEGGEGEGKTNTSCVEAYYVKYKTGRDVHLFFRLEPLINFAKSTEKKIIIWDEPSLDSLSADNLTTLNRDLTRLLMTARKKRHFLIINMTKFWKFNEYIVVERALGLVHMYSRREIDPGRFVYIPKKHLEELYTTFKSKRKRLYKSLSTLRGTFPDIMKKHFDRMGFHVNNIPNATYTIYDQEKDKAIHSIGDTEKKSKKETKIEKSLEELRYKVAMLAKKRIIPIEEMANIMDIGSNRIREWAKLGPIQSVSLENVGSEASPPPVIITKRVDSEKNHQSIVVAE